MMSVCNGTFAEKLKSVFGKPLMKILLLSHWLKYKINALEPAAAGKYRRNKLAAHSCDNNVGHIAFGNVFQTVRKYKLTAVGKSVLFESFLG